LLPNKEVKNVEICFLRDHGIFAVAERSGDRIEFLGNRSCCRPSNADSNRVADDLTDSHTCSDAVFSGRSQETVPHTDA
jgi:hypothetical protein